MKTTKSTSLSIFIYNFLEGEWKIISSITSKKQRKSLIDAGQIFSDAYLFMNIFEHNRILITPVPVTKEYAAYVQELSGTVQQVFTPRPRIKSPFICQNVVRDPVLLQKLVDAAQAYNNTITLLPYVSSTYVYTLARALQKRGVTVRLPETPEEKNLWTVDTYGSKAGFRETFAAVMPEGYICNSIKEASEKAYELYTRDKAVVVKTNRGNAGLGTSLFRPGDLPTQKKACMQALRKHCAESSFWRKDRIVVEKYIDTTGEKVCQFPSIEGYVTHDGKLQIPYYCNMIVSKEGEFCGIEMHKDVVPASTLKKLLAVTRKVGTTYAKNGYHGTFDIDFLYDGKRLYANESNTRTNGGTDVYRITRKLVGDRFFTDRYVLNDFIETDHLPALPFAGLLTLLKPYLYNHKKKTGLVIGSAGAIRRYGIPYIIIASSKTHAKTLATRMQKTLEKTRAHNT